ncbi:MAG: glycosyltransferase family 2 protein [Deltaproteobacteria bacterium]|nr:glycosyltransferase family 2 protein [Deltaproteobacteria bacterium]
MAMLLSVIVPCLNEEEVIDGTHRHLVEVLSHLTDLDFEIIYIDDGSRDNTGEILKTLQTADERVKVIRFSRNFGQQIAITAGLEHAAGDAVVLIDADLQDPPEVIPDMVDRWREGWQVVYGRRTHRPGETRLKLWTAKLFYRLINKLSEVAMPLDTGEFRLMDRQVVNALLAMPERYRFIRGMVSWAGFRQVAVPYERVARQAGQTKYSYLKMLGLALDAIISFSIAPLKVAAWMGFLASGLALLGIVYALVLRVFTSIWVPGWTLLFIVILFLGGVQLISLGIIGEYVGRTYGEVKMRPLYVVLERLGFREVQPPGKN